MATGATGAAVVRGGVVAEAGRYLRTSSAGMAAGAERRVVSAGAVAVVGPAGDVAAQAPSNGAPTASTTLYRTRFIFFTEQSYAVRRANPVGAGSYQGQRGLSRADAARGLDTHCRWQGAS